jgi:hypothetical protein
MRDAPRLARIVEKRREAQLLFKNGEGKAHGGGSRISPTAGNHAFRNPLTRVNPSSKPY